MKRRIALGALVAAVALVVLGGAALAAFPPTISLTAPVEGQTWGPSPSTDLHVIGTADTNDGDVVTRVNIIADPTDNGTQSYPAEAAFSGDNAHESFDVKIYPDRNGKYKITVIASGRDCNIIGCGSEMTGPAVTRNVTVAWPPKTPTGVKASIKDGVVTIEWAANDIGDEPDLLGYMVEGAVGSGTFSCLKTVPVDSKKPAIYKTTRDLTTQPDGDYKYRVRALRAANADTQMPTCTTSAAISSPPSAVATVSWDNPTPPPTTTTTKPGGSGGGGGGGGAGGGGTTTTTRRGATTGGSGRAPTRPNLSALGSLGVPTNLAKPPGARPEEDPGFNQLLPFGASEETVTEGGVALPQGPDEGADDSGGGTTTLLFVAAGLLATVLSAHVLWLKAQVDKMPLEALIPEDVPLGG